MQWKPFQLDNPICTVFRLQRSDCQNSEQDRNVSCMDVTWTQDGMSGEEKHRPPLERR